MRILNLRLKPEMLARYDLPDILYPVSADTFDLALGHGGHLPIASMLYHLQNRSCIGDADWLGMEAAMDRLAQLVGPNDPRPILSAAGENWWLEIGPIDLTGPIVTIQRGDNLIAAVAAINGGLLRVASYRPLDAKSAIYLLGLGQKPISDHGVCMRENNWEYALDSAASTGNYYAASRGEAYLSYWQNGIGNFAGSSQDHHWLAMQRMRCRKAAVTVAEIGVHYSLGGT